MTDFDRRATPLRTRAAQARDLRALEDAHARAARPLEGDEFDLSALAAPWPPAPAALPAPFPSAPADACPPHEVEREDDADEDALSHDPTTIRARSSGPPVPASRPSLVGLPRLTEPPQSQALDDVAVHVTRAPLGRIISVPPPRSGTFANSAVPRIQRVSSPAARSTRAQRQLGLGLAAALFAALGAWADQTGLLDAAPFPVAPAPHTAVTGSPSRAFASSEPAVEAPAAEAPLGLAVDIAEPEVGGVIAPSADIESLVERAKRLLSAADTVHLRELELALLRARQLSPENPHVRGCLGEVLLRRGNYDAAFAEAVEAVHLRPKRARYRVLLGDVYRAQHNPSAAEAAYQKARELDVRMRADGAELRAIQLL